MAEAAQNYRYRYDYAHGYAYGSSARQPDEYPDAPAPRRRTPPPGRARRRTVRNKSRTIVVVSRDAKKSKVSLPSMISLIIIFTGALGIVLMSAMISGSKAALAGVNGEIKAEQEKIDSLRAQLTVTQNLAEIEEIAVNRLGMSRPKPYQIIRIEVPRQSYVVSGSDDSGPADGGGFSLSGVLGVFGGQP